MYYFSQITSAINRDLVVSFTHNDFPGVTTIQVTLNTPSKDLYICNLGIQSLYVIINGDSDNPIEILSSTEEQIPFQNNLITTVQINGYTGHEFKAKAVA